jgi:hypothetical protein
LLIGLIYGTKFKYSRKCAENLFPGILAEAHVCNSSGGDDDKKAYCEAEFDKYEDMQKGLELDAGFFYC